MLPPASWITDVVAGVADVIGILEAGAVEVEVVFLSCQYQKPPATARSAATMPTIMKTFLFFTITFIIANPYLAFSGKVDGHAINRKRISTVVAQ